MASPATMSGALRCLNPPLLRRSLVRPTVSASPSTANSLHGRFCSPPPASTLHQPATATSVVVVRHRHSQTQVKRLFKNHPARSRVFARNGMIKKPGTIPERKYPKVFEPKVVLPNGWSSPPPGADDEGNDEEGFVMPTYPFHVHRTEGKPNGGPGFLPVYSDKRVHGTKHTTIIRRVSGDRDAFLTELRAVLGLESSGGDNVGGKIRIRTGGNIEVDGNRVGEVKEWLGGLGF